MNTIPSAMAVAAVAALTFAAGCSNGRAMQATVAQEKMPAEDGVVCPDNASGRGGPTVYVDVQYAPDGTPSAQPNKCFIDSGTVIVWRDPPDRTTMFNLVFSDAKTKRGLGTLRAAQVAERYKLSSRITGNKDDVIKYGIQANGKTVDPAVIIK